MAKRKRGLPELLSQVPTALFPIALGLTGLGAAFRLAGALFELAWMEAAGVALLIVAAAVLVRRRRSSISESSCTPTNT